MSKTKTKLLSLLLMLSMIAGLILPAALGVEVYDEANPFGSALGTNLLQNGNFPIPLGTSGSGWTAQIIAPGAAGAREVITEGPDAPSQRIPVTNPGTANWNMLFQQMFTFEAGVEYDFYLIARASVNRPMQVQFLNQPTPDTWNVQDHSLQLTTEWQTFGPFRAQVQATDLQRQINLVLGGMGPATPHDVFFREAILVDANESIPTFCPDCNLADCECQVEPSEEGYGVRPVARPVAGHFPTGFYRLFLRPNGSAGYVLEHNYGYYQSIDWYPAVPRDFQTNTVYTATVTLEPHTTSLPEATNGWWRVVFCDNSDCTNPHDPADRIPPHNPGGWALREGMGMPVWPPNFSSCTTTKSATFAGVTIDDLYGLPTDGVTNIVVNNDGSNLVIEITFEATGATVQPATRTFFDDFSGEVNTDRPGGLTTEFARATDGMFRQHMSYWSWDNVNIEERDGNNVLVISNELLRTDPNVDDHNAYIDELLLDYSWISPNQRERDNLIRAGGARTISHDWYEIYFEQSFGYWEARIQLPKERGMWGAFWLMNRYQGTNVNFHQGAAARQGRTGAELDIVEAIISSAANYNNSAYNFATHWNGWGGMVDGSWQGSRSFSMGANRNTNGVEMDIFDGNWHIFSFEWTPTSYTVFLNGIPFAHHERGMGTGNRALHEISHNPTYIKLTTEAGGASSTPAAWPLGAGMHFRDDFFAEMVVDYVAVWNGPRPTPNVLPDATLVGVEIEGNALPEDFVQAVLISDPPTTPLRPAVTYQWQHAESPDGPWVNVPNRILGTGQATGPNRLTNHIPSAVTTNRRLHLVEGDVDLLNEYIRVTATHAGVTVASAPVLFNEAPPEKCPDCMDYDCICDNLHVGRVGDIRMIRTPVAGEFPSSAFLNPSRDNGASGNAHANGFHTTFTWYPAVEHYFLPDTVYTVSVLLEPNDRWGQASGTATSGLLPVQGANNVANRLTTRIAGFHGNGITPRNFGLGRSTSFGDCDQPAFASLWDLPGVTDITWEYGRSPVTVGSQTTYGNLTIHITFEATGAEVEEARLVFFDDFTGPINNQGGLEPQGITTAFVRSPQHSNRQGMDSWRDRQSTIEERNYGTGGSVLRLGLQHNRDLAVHANLWGSPPTAFQSNNWIEAGSVRTRGQSGGTGGMPATGVGANIYFEHAFGHYEARIKFPQVNATWGAFWLMYSQGSVQRGYRSARIGSEIDQIETAANPFANFNAASHWNGYTYDHANPTNHLFGPNGATRNRNTNWVPLPEYLSEIGNIYDGEWHTFAVQWTPTDYIFLINDIEWARRSRPETFNWGGSTDPNVDEGWGWGGLIGPHMLNDPRHFGGVAENPNYMKLSVEAADWSGLGVDGPGLSIPCPAGSCPDCDWVSNRNDETNGLGWHRIDTDEMLVDWVKVWNGPKPESAMYRPAPTEFAGTNPANLENLLQTENVVLQTPSNLGIFAQHSPFTVPAGRTLYVQTTLNIQRGAELIIEGTVVVLPGGRINNQGNNTSGGTITIEDGGRLVNDGHVENVSNSNLFNNGTITNNARFEVRARTVFIDDGTVGGSAPLSIHRDAIRQS